MKKTNKEQMLPEEVEVQTPASSRFYNFINNIDYKKHCRILDFLFLSTIILSLSFLVMVWCAL